MVRAGSRFSSRARVMESLIAFTASSACASRAPCRTRMMMTSESV